MLTTRRHFLRSSTFGVGSVALATLLDREGLLASPDRPELVRPRSDLTARSPHFAPRAQAMISLFMQGGPSHHDLFDPKPEMAKYDGKPFPGSIKYDNAAQASSKVLATPWKFKKHGQCGMEISELLPHLAGVVDDICLIRSLHTDVNNHEQSIHSLHNGSIAAGRPVLGSWVAYALGSETQSLPAYVALTDPVSLPVVGVQNWSNGWLPSLYQGTVIGPKEPRIQNLDPPSQLRGVPQAGYLEYLNKLNRAHLERHPGETDLEGRIATYELAAHMQTAARAALDLSGESPATKKLYGLDDPATAEYGTRCLLARRLIERGVRFVQIFTRNQFWDHHGAIRTALPASCKYVDRGSAALVADLKARGLLDTTLVHWGGEMGRLPVIQNDAGSANVGRDHNTYGFSSWLAGGGIKGGMVHGATDDFGHKAVVNPVSHRDFHATLLHLFGLDGKRLVYHHNGREQSLLDGNAGRVVTEIVRS